MRCSPRKLFPIYTLVLLCVAFTSHAFAAKGGAAALTVTPTNIAFGTMTVGSSRAAQVVMQNTSTASLTVYSDSFTGAGFSTMGLALPQTLAAGQSVAFQVVYSPSAAASSSATLYLKKSNGGTLATIAMSGTGTAAADTIAPAVSVTSPGNGSTISGTATLSANASDNVGVAAVQFYVNNTAIGPRLTTGPYSVAWDTTVTSNGSGYVVTAVAWDAAGNQTSSTGISTSVSNTTAVQHAASLSWAASTSTIVGYYVYRSAQSGGPYTRVSSSPDTATLFTDSAVSGGQTYYYVVTAVDSNGIESSYSNETMAQIPQ